MGRGQNHNQIDTTDQRRTARCLTTRRVEARASSKGWARASTIQIDQQAAPLAGCVVARTGHNGAPVENGSLSAPFLSRARRPTGEGTRFLNGGSGFESLRARHTSRCTTSFAGVAFPQTSVIARGRMGTPTRVSAARTQVHVEQLFGHDATCMGAGGQFVGLPLIFDRLDHIAQYSTPIAHRPNAHIARPACRDGEVMRETQSGVAFERTSEMNRNA